MSYENYYYELDVRAKYDAKVFITKGKISNVLLKRIIDMYKQAQVEKSFNVVGKFESAYHAPVTSNFEFYLARFLFHYSEAKHLGWKIYLRRQIKGCAPDIRIEKDEKTIGVVEIKLKAGWIQPIFNGKYKEIYSKNTEQDKDIEDSIKKFSKQIDKYIEGYGVAKKKIFVLLPTMTHVHRKKANMNMNDYRKTFKNNSKLFKNSLVLLSSNLSLDLASNDIMKSKLSYTSEFEEMIKKIEE